MKKIFLAVLITFASNLLAQEKDTTYKYWVTLGLGVIKTSINLSYNFSIDDKFYKVGYLNRGGLLTTTGKDGYLYNSMDISIGKRLQTEWFQISLFSGPSYVFGKKRATSGDHEKYNTIGLETDAQLLFRAANEVGIGLGLYSNLNFERSYAGINISLTLGNGK